MMRRLTTAIRRCVPFAVSIFLTYVVAAAIGGTMAHAGNGFALARRDAMVSRTLASDRASIDYRAGRRVRAALTDAAANFGLAALPQTVAGLTVVVPYATVFAQGWAGGIVSVDGRHRSRLRTGRGAAYYLGVLLLQFIPFSLCIGGGVRFGITFYAENRQSGWQLRGYRIPRPAAADLLWVVAASIPLFLAASLFEFLSSWNL